MNKEEIEKLKSKILEFQGKDLFIKLQNSIEYHFTINNAKIIISNQKLVISDEAEQDFILQLHYIENVKIVESMVYIELSNNIEIIIDG